MCWHQCDTLAGSVDASIWPLISFFCLRRQCTRFLCIQMVCIYASEVAALAGLHKYTTQEEAVRAVLRRQGINDAAARAQRQHFKCKESSHVLQGIADAANDDAIAKETVAHAKAQAAATKAQDLYTTSVKKHNRPEMQPPLQLLKGSLLKTPQRRQQQKNKPLSILHPPS